MSDDKEEFAELYAFKRMGDKYPQIGRAISSTQTTFGAAAKPGPGDLGFLTRCSDAPLKVEGVLGPDGIYRFWCFHMVPDDLDRELEIEILITEKADHEFWMVCDGSLADAMIRDAIPKALAQMSDPETRAAFERRISQSRFASNLRFH